MLVLELNLFDTIILDGPLYSSPKRFNLLALNQFVVVYIKIVKILIIVIKVVFKDINLLISLIKLLLIKLLMFIYNG